MQDAYNELSYYTLSLGDVAFIHQHIVDAYAAQTAGEHTKPITIVFALAGLYLYLEKGYTGRQVQQAHLQMAKHKDQIKAVSLPAERGDITVTDVLATPSAEAKNRMIHKWCAVVWSAYAPVQKEIRAVTDAMLRA